MKFNFLAKFYNLLFLWVNIKILFKKDSSFVSFTRNDDNMLCRHSEALAEESNAPCKVTHTQPHTRHAKRVSASYKAGKPKISFNTTKTLKLVQGDNQKSAFSLVEILVALIIVSLITAAMAPIITKKLSSAGITIVGGGSGGGDGGEVDVESNDGMCTTCEDGFVLQGNQCVTANFSFEFDGAFSDTVNSFGYQKIFLKSSGTFKPKVTKKGKMLLVGGGGGSANIYKGGGGGGGYVVETNFTFEKDVPYTVTIGAGGAVAGNGGKTVFGTNSANGGKASTGASGGAGQGNGGTHGGSGAGAGYQFDGIYYGGGGGAGRHAASGGSGGGGQGGGEDCKTRGQAGRANRGGGAGGSGGESGCSSFYGAKGGTGVVIIIFEENSSTTKDPIQKPCSEVNGADYTCTACPVGFTLSGTKCVISPFEYTYTGSYSDSTNSYGYQKITLKGSGTFKPTVDKKVRMLLVGGGGGSGSAYHSGGGGGGYCNETYMTLKANTSYNVTIGSGGGAGSSGGRTSFGTNFANAGLGGSNGTGGAGQGYGGTYGATATGGAGCQFDGVYYGGGGGAGRNGYAGGSGGGGAGSGSSTCGAKGTAGTANRGGGAGGSGGASSCSSFSGSSGGSGVVIILIEESPSATLDPNQCDAGGGSGGSGGSGGGGTTLKTNCAEIDSNCQLCTASKCLVCKNKYDLIDGTCHGEAAVDINSQVTHPITTSCADIDENCTSCTSGGCLTCAENYVLDGGACVEKFRKGEPRNQIDCEPLNAVFVPKEYTGTFNKNICVSKTNVAQTNDYSIPYSNINAGYWNYYLLRSGETPQHVLSYTMFRGQTANNFANSQEYNLFTSGRTRSVGGYRAFADSCSMSKYGGAESWTILRKYLFDAWIANYSSSAELRSIIAQLNLCIADNVSGFIQCKDTTTNHCKGMVNNTCYPYLIWAYDSDTGNDTAELYEYSQSGFSLFMHNPDNGYAASGRCFTSLVPLR